MKCLPVYELGQRSDASVVVRANLEFFRDRFHGDSLANNWLVPLLHILQRTKPLKDFIAFHLSAPTVSQRARDALEPLIGPHCEFLPLVQFGGTMYYCVNVLNVVDCFDWGNSEILFAEDGKTIAIAHRVVFVNDRIPNAPIFKADPHSNVYVRSSFVECVLSNQLTNAVFGDPGVDSLPLICCGKEISVVPEAPR